MNRCCLNKKSSFLKITKKEMKSECVGSYSSSLFESKKINFLFIFFSYEIRLKQRCEDDTKFMSINKQNRQFEFMKWVEVIFFFASVYNILLLCVGDSYNTILSVTHFRRFQDSKFLNLSQVIIIDFSYLNLFNTQNVYKKNSKNPSFIQGLFSQSGGEWKKIQ